jgi:hypothetical protein
VAGLCALLCGACDQGMQTDESPPVGLPIHYTANVGSGAPLQCMPDPATPTTCVGAVELAFDRLLLPVTVTRQSVFLSDTRMPPTFFTPTLAYDPVARVVRITPTPDQPFTVGQTYRVQIASPASPSDPTGLHAIDGATLDPALQGKPVEFPVAAGAMPPAAPPTVSFCTLTVPIISSCATISGCHFQYPALGLVLRGSAIKTTAIGRVAEEANWGAFSHAQPVSRFFGQDMPIVDPGDPGNSWLLYKTLMATPSATALTTTASAHSVPWMPLANSERATLASMIPGREMPFPVDTTMLAPGLELDTLESISLWIAQGATVPDTCP